MPKVSVIIPVYKVEQYLRQCLDSVIAQTFKDIEIICVDDGSPDNCPQILEKYAAKDSRICVIHQENKGQAAARNSALTHVTGKYILYVDSDDWIKPELCEKTITAAEKGNADMTWFFYEHPIMASQKIFNRIERIITEHSVFDVDSIPFRDAMSMITYPVPWSKLWRTDFIKNNNIEFAVDEHGRCLGHEDVAQHWIALLHCPKSMVVPERLYQYRYVPSSSSCNPETKHSNSFPKTIDVMKQATVSAGLYHGKWKELFLYQKLFRLQAVMKKIAARWQKQYLQDIHESIGDDEWEYLSQSKNLPVYVKDFYRALDGSVAAKLRNMLIWNPARRVRDTLRLAIARIRK